MPNMTLAIPLETHKTMKRHPEIKWTEVARQAIEQKAKKLKNEKDEWREYALRHAVETGWSEADELINY
ncbi:MAG: hypothetical protein V1847_05325 [Candidatus Diapherotrites archaeon]